MYYKTKKKKKKLNTSIEFVFNIHIKMQEYLLK